EIGDHVAAQATCARALRVRGTSIAWRVSPLRAFAGSVARPRGEPLQTLTVITPASAYRDRACGRDTRGRPVRIPNSTRGQHGHHTYEALGSDGGRSVGVLAGR